MKIDYKGFGLLPYQAKWIEDTSHIKIYEKSRRIGITRTQALEDVIDAGIYNKYDVWFSSNNDLNGKEYIKYCTEFATALNLVIKHIGKGDDILSDSKNYSIDFKNGKRISAVSSSPEQLHGKGGKIVLDEFARRDDDVAVWEAAAPAALVWNYPIRIISTHNGKNTLFYKFIKEVINGKRKWSHHKTTILNAINQGIVNKALAKKATKKEKQKWLSALKNDVGSNDIFKQQFLCEPLDATSTFLTYSLIESCAVLKLRNKAYLTKTSNPLYIGIDVARKNNLTVIWVVEQINNVYKTCYLKAIKNETLPTQKAIIYSICCLSNVQKVVIDATGIGLGLVEELQVLHGESLISGVTFTPKIKEALAFNLKKMLEDKRFLIPNKDYIIEDFHGIKKEVTITGNIRLLASGNEKDTHSHNDYFWAATLALSTINAAYTSLAVHTPLWWQSQRSKYKNTLSWN